MIAIFSSAYCHIVSRANLSVWLTDRRFITTFILSPIEACSACDFIRWISLVTVAAAVEVNVTVQITKVLWIMKIIDIMNFLLMSVRIYLLIVQYYVMVTIIVIQRITVGIN